MKHTCDNIILHTVDYGLLSSCEYCGYFLSDF